MITSEIKYKIKQHALANIPKEICGLIVNINNNLEVIQCENISYQNKTNCILNPLDYIRAAKKGKIIGFYHSHESKNISIIDNLNAAGHNILSIIYSWKEDEFYIIYPELSDFLRLDFKIGSNDCYSLVRNYYKKILNINLNDYYRDENWMINSPNIMIDNFKTEGFHRIDFKDIQKNDVIIFEFNGKPCHMAIWMENNFILHCPRDSESVIVELSEPLKRRIYLVVRHHSL